MTEHVVPPRTYFLVAGALLALLALTVVSAEIDLGPFNALVALAIAAAKAILVILYFMEVRYSSRLTWFFAGAGFFWLLILVALTLSDVMNRPALPFPLM
jgi:cytochrome c oxidase subunit IV